MEKIKWIEEYLEQALEVAWMEGHERAINLLDKLLYEEPGYGRLHYTLGVIYFRYADETKLAETHLRLAVQFCPEYAESYNVLAEVLKQDERHDETIDVCQLGLKAEKADKSLLLKCLGIKTEIR